MNELTNSTSTPSFGRNIPSSTTTDPAVLEGWGARAYNTEISVSAQHELAPRVSVSGGWYRRKFGNQTVTVDNRYSFAKGSYDGPFCANAPADPNLPGGGGYQVCGLYDLKPAVVAQQLPTSSTLHVLVELRRRDEHLRGLRLLDDLALRHRRVPATPASRWASASSISATWSNAGIAARR